MFETNWGDAKATAPCLPPLTLTPTISSPQHPRLCQRSHCWVRDVSVPVILLVPSPGVAALLAPAEAGCSPAQGWEAILTRR